MNIKKLNTTTLIATLIAICLMSIGTSPAQGQDGYFDNLILDPAGDPFIRFVDSTGNAHFISSNEDWMGLYVKNGYKFRVFENAAKDALWINDQGVLANKLFVGEDATVNGNATINGDLATLGNADFQENISVGRTISIKPTVNYGKYLNIQHQGTSQSFGIRSLASNQGLHNGGIGFSTDSSSYPLWVFDTAKSESLTVREEGVGIGTYNAEAPLHVYGDGLPYPEAKIVVENNHSGTPVQREMFKLVNNGSSLFSFTDTSLNSTWFFASDTNGRFTASLSGTGGAELTIGQDGRVLMGPGPVQNFDLRPNGNLHILGTLYQSSDRNLKKNFESVDTRSVLEKIAEIPVTTWQFKKDNETVRHMGPTSQDFRAAFGLGDNDRTIAPVDGIGVTLAGIQALHAEAKAKDDKIVALTKQLSLQQVAFEAQQAVLEEQQSLLEELSERLDSLESR